ncbi:MAG: peptidoglycan DD-metalloendopeptidase family protein [Candidatus Omnitrophota bacterium]
MRGFKKQVFIYVLMWWISGCATLPYPSRPPGSSGAPGIYHKVERGETIWRISRIYNIEMEELVSVNRISDAASIEVGQMIFIPNRRQPQPVNISPSSEDFAWPLKGKVVSTYGQTFNEVRNKGINIQPSRDAQIVAARSGKVVFSADKFHPYGKTIIIDHGDGLSTVYSGISQISVKPGERVEKNSAIASIKSAPLDAGPGCNCLHFEIRKGHLSRNPYFYLP